MKGKLKILETNHKSKEAPKQGEGFPPKAVNVTVQNASKFNQAKITRSSFKCNL